MAHKLKNTMLILGVTFGLLIILEAISFLLLQSYYNRHIPNDTIALHRFGETNGLKPNIATTIWGKKFSTDAVGSRPQKKQRNLPKKIWIGDSVLEGLGVDDEDIFTSLLQTKKDSVDYFNFGHAGNTVADYLNILHAVIDTAAFSPIYEINIALCLNDIYPKEVKPISSKAPWIQQLNVLFSHFHLYRFLKLWIYRNSDFYFRYDAQFYKDETKVHHLIDKLASMNALCKQKGIRYKVYIFPYRSQFASANFFPQQTIAYHLGMSGIDFEDLAPKLAAAKNKNELYLFADEIHFSKMGHALLATVLYP